MASLSFAKPSPSMPGSATVLPAAARPRYKRILVALALRLTFEAIHHLLHGIRLESLLFEFQFHNVSLADSK